MTHGCKVFLISDTGEKFFGRGPAELLELVDQLGSLHQAASQMYLSYAKALRILHAAEAGFGFPLVTRKIGGTCGGGSALTEAGREVLTRFRAYEAAVDKAAQAQFALCFPSQPNAPNSDQ